MADGLEGSVRVDREISAHMGCSIGGSFGFAGVFAFALFGDRAGEAAGGLGLLPHAPISRSRVASRLLCRLPGSGTLLWRSENVDHQILMTKTPALHGHVNELLSKSHGTKAVIKSGA